MAAAYWLGGHFDSAHSWTAIAASQSYTYAHAEQLSVFDHLQGNCVIKSEKAEELFGQGGSLRLSQSKDLYNSHDSGKIRMVSSTCNAREQDFWQTGRKVKNIQSNAN